MSTKISYFTEHEFKYSLQEFFYDSSFQDYVYKRNVKSAKEVDIDGYTYRIYFYKDAYVIQRRRIGKLLLNSFGNKYVWVNLRVHYIDDLGHSLINDISSFNTEKEANDYWLHYILEPNQFLFSTGASS